MRIKFLILFLILILTQKNIYSQEESSGGSPYSIFGIGDINYFTSTRTYSMGILGISLFGNYINNLNPSTITKLKATTISIDANYGFLKSSNATLENKVSNGNVLGVNIGIPLDQGRGWVLSLGFNPVSLMNYKIRVDGSIAGQNYIQTYSGKGGLSRINVGMAYNALRKISIGVEYNYAFGELRQQNFINFNSTFYTNTNIKNQIDFSKSFLKAGLVLEPGRIFNSTPLRNLALGFVFESGLNLDATQDGIYITSISTDTVQLNTGEVEIPEAYGFGISNIFGRRYVVSADVLFHNWEKYREFGQARQDFQSSYRAGLGFEILPNPDNHSFFGSMTYRFGGFYDKAFYKVSNQDVNTYGIRTGVNIPLSKYNSIDFGINYSIRGKTENGLIKDEFLNLTAGFNFGELWFLRPREEDQ